MNWHRLSHYFRDKRTEKDIWQGIQRLLKEEPETLRHQFQQYCFYHLRPDFGDARLHTAWLIFAIQHFAPSNNASTISVEATADRIQHLGGTDKGNQVLAGLLFGDESEFNSALQAALAMRFDLHLFDLTEAQIRALDEVQTYISNTGLRRLQEIVKDLRDRLVSRVQTDLLPPAHPSPARVLLGQDISERYSEELQAVVAELHILPGTKLYPWVLDTQNEFERLIDLVSRRALRFKNFAIRGATFFLALIVLQLSSLVNVEAFLNVRFFITLYLTICIIMVVDIFSTVENAYDWVDTRIETLYELADTP
jgi:hypothetical protein